MTNGSQVARRGLRGEADAVRRVTLFIVSIVGGQVGGGRA